MVFFMPTTAMMSPAKMASLSSRWLACIWRMRPTRSFLSLVELLMESPFCSVPEYTRM